MIHTERAKWQWRRLRAMPPAEIAHRASRVVRDRALAVRYGTPPKDRPSTAEQGSPPRPLFWWAGLTPEDRRQRLEEHAPAAVSTLRATADRILAGEIPLFGDWVRAGNPPDWHRDPLSGASWARSAASRIDLQSAAREGVRRVWELSRHHELVAIAQAHAVSGAEEYAAALRSRWAHWLLTNPSGEGVNWTSSLELAMRVASWAWAWALLDGTGAVPPELAESILASVREHGRWIETHPSLFSSANNHRIGEAAGLTAIGLLWPDLPEAARWRRRGLRTLATEVERQVTADGVSREQAFHYQAFVLDWCLWIVDLSRRAGEQLPAAFAERLRSAARFLRWVMDADGGIPSVGDGDDGWVLRFACGAERPYRALLQAAAVTFQDGALDPDGDDPEEELLWRLGPEGVRSWRELRPARVAYPSRAFEGGYVVQRVGAGAAARVAVLDCGPLGLPPLAAHGHADALSLTLSVGGTAALIDGGTFGYHEQQEWRPHFRGTSPHNTVTVDGRDQSEAGGPFLWTRHARAVRERWLSSPALDLVRASHDGYAVVGVTHRRTVVFRKPDTWLVLDELSGAGHHHVAQRFHLASGPVDLDAPSLRASGAGVTLIGAVVPGVALRFTMGSEVPREGWRSPRFGRLEPSPEVVFEWQGGLPVTLVTVISAAVAPDSVELGAGPPGTVLLKLLTGGFEDRVAVSQPPVASVEADGLRARGELAWLRVAPDGRPVWLGGLNLEQLSWHGESLHEGLTQSVDTIAMVR